MAGNPAPTQADYEAAWASDAFYPAKGHLDLLPWRKPVTDDPWPFTPENCGFAAYTQGHWTRDGMLLICAGCGLDCT